ncbi:hypothetical protein [Pseudomonas marincola]|uniref:hypothetical protein n=1 Tax=Pseudomonas marincola TaxID=437900 RepID=UPI00113026FF|nr:hypothetical protein [Pseudomonas marincola]
MNTPKTAHAPDTQLHRNLKLVATVATVATASNHGAYSRCHLIKEVATGGNTNTLLNIRACHVPFIWLSLLPLKMKWQQIGIILNPCKPRARAVVATVATVATLFETRRTCVLVFLQCGGKP